MICGWLSQQNVLLYDGLITKLDIREKLCELQLWCV